MFGHIVQKLPALQSHKKHVVGSYSSFLHNCQQLEANKMSFNWPTGIRWEAI